MSHVHAIGYHNDRFGPRSTTSLVIEKTTPNPTWQVWIMMPKIVGSFFLGGVTLEGRHDIICGRNLGRHVPSKRHWVILHVLLYGYLQKMGYHSHLRAMAECLLCERALSVTNYLCLAQH